MDKTIEQYEPYYIVYIIYCFIELMTDGMHV